MKSKTAVALLTLSAWVGGNCCSARRLTWTSTAPSLPKGWAKVGRPGDRHPGLWDVRDWKVSLQGQVLKIQDYQPPAVRCKFPFRIKSATPDDGIYGDCVYERVNDGWLVGYNAGEFGGSLWWVSADGRRSTRLSRENVVAFAELSTEKLVLVGLSHLGGHRGKVLKIGGPTPSGWKVKTLVDLKAAPRAVLKESPSSLLLLTEESLFRIGKTEGLRRRWKGTRFIWYTKSMVRTQTRIIFIGTRHFVIKLTPTQGGFREEWFEPPKWAHQISGP